MNWGLIIVVGIMCWLSFLAGFGLAYYVHGRATELRIREWKDSERKD